MQRTLTTLFALMLFTIMGLSAAYAQTAPFSFGLEGSLSRGTGDFGDAVELGQQFGVVLERQVSPTTAIGFSLGRHGWDANSDFNYALSVVLSSLIDPTFDPFFDPPLVDASARYEATEYTGHVRLFMANESSGMRPYLEGGIGGYSMKVKVALAGIGEEDESYNLLGINLGGGVDFPVGTNTTLAIGAKYHYIASEDDLGANTTALALGARLSFGFGR